MSTIQIVVGENKASRKQTVFVWTALIAIMLAVILPILLIGLKGGWIAGMAVAEVVHPWLKRRIAGVETARSELRNSWMMARAFAAAFILFNVGWFLFTGSL